jgi:hypothetical protein
MSDSSRAVLRLVRERKLAELVHAPRGAVLEASGVVAKGREYLVVFDNIRRVARIGADLAPQSGAHGWVGRSRGGEGFEDIAYSPHQRRFYLLVEAEKHPDGTYKSVIEECDEAWRSKGRAWVDFPFKKRNTGLEGLSAVRWRGADYLLALCEGNNCLPNPEGEQPGGGRIHVLQKSNRMWQSVAVIKLPSNLNFKDYSALALRGNRVAVVSQRSACMWVGTLRREDWTIGKSGRTYDFPRTKNKGKRIYCTVEGVSWLSANTLVMVSDLSKKGYPGRCGRTDQSIHIFRLGR